VRAKVTGWWSRVIVDDRVPEWRQGSQEEQSGHVTVRKKMFVTRSEALRGVYIHGSRDNRRVCKTTMEQKEWKQKKPERKKLKGPETCRRGCSRKPPLFRELFPQFILPKQE
jgi:hypothetical protein